MQGLYANGLFTSTGFNSAAIPVLAFAVLPFTVLAFAALPFTVLAFALPAHLQKLGGAKSHDSSFLCPNTKNYCHVTSHRSRSNRALTPPQ